MDFKIEKAKPTDAEELLEYLKKVGSESDNLTFGGEGMPFSVEQEASFIEGVNSSERSTLVVAKYNGKVIGIVSLDVSERERLKHKGELGISVLKDYWGNGIGRLLMQEIIKFAIFRGIEVIHLSVRSDNERAIKLYEKFGFEKCGVVPGDMKINGKLVDCDIMYLKI